MKQTIMITGATAGIGRAIAERFAAEKYRLILTGRRAGLLEEIKKELTAGYGCDVLTMAFDIRSGKEVEDHMESLPFEWRSIDILVNNAGLASGLDPVDQANVDDWDAMIDTNIKGLLYISGKVIPWMTQRRKGHIFNIGSIAGREVYPKGGVYCATKHAVDALTKGMRIDLLPYGIKVTQISPGAVETDFSIVRFKGDRERAEKVYMGYEPLKAEDIAHILYFISTLPERVNINDILVMPQAQANATTFHKF